MLYNTTYVMVKELTFAKVRDQKLTPLADRSFLLSAWKLKHSASLM